MSDKAVGWVRQAPGKALEWLGSIDTSGSTGYNPGLKPRLSINKDNSKSQVSLSVSDVAAEDSATYYCGTVFQKTVRSCPEGYNYSPKYNDAGTCTRPYDCRRCESVYPAGNCARCSGTTYIDTYEFYVDAWGQGLQVTISSEGE
nr:immunoglobulin mu heavy chain [Bos taurus]